MLNIPLKCKAARRIVSGAGVTLYFQRPRLSHRRLKSTKVVTHKYKFEYGKLEVVEVSHAVRPSGKSKLAYLPTFRGLYTLLPSRKRKTITIFNRSQSDWLLHAQ